MSTVFEKEKFFINDSIRNDEGLISAFYGYSSGDEIYHYKKNIPDIEKLYDSYFQNCGVFSAVFKKGRKIIAFTDPLGQYPLFYWSEAEKFCLSNDFYEVANYSKGEVDEYVVQDYLTYFSPIDNKTLVKGCLTLPAGSVIEISFDNAVPKLTVLSIKPVKFNGNYSEVLALCVDRLRLRARGLMAMSVPLVHLTGGLDSRLAFASFLSASNNTDEFDVFCLGDGTSQDKLIFNKLVEKYDLNIGVMSMCGGRPSTEFQLENISARFNGLKVTNHSNFIPDWNPCRVEVTGYFSGGLLKDFGGYFKGERFDPFAYAKSTSCLPDCVFDASAFKMHEGITANKHLTSLVEDKCNLFYINNRSKAHFGMHSVVNNSNFLSFDILYDPMFLELYRLAPYNSYQKGRGVVILDLIKGLATEELALFPLADSTMPLYGDYIKDTPQGSNCFTKIKFDTDPNDKALPIYKIANQSDKTDNLGNYKEYIKLKKFDAFFDRHPELLQLRDKSVSGRSDIEILSLVSVFGILDKLNALS